MTNHLLLVGIDKYLYQNALNNCVKDLNDFRDVLLEKFDFDESNIIEIYNQQATSRIIQDTIRKYGSTLSLTDNLVIYFSGHGHYDEKTKRGFWIPVDGTTLSYTTWIANDTLIALINSINCKHIFIISDACFSNSLLNFNPTKSLNDYSNFKSRWALTSSYRLAFDSEKGKNSFFASSIIDFIKSTDRDFRIGELIEYTKITFSNNELQTPQGGTLFCKGHSGGEMTFQIKQTLDKRNLRGYNDFQGVLKLYKRTSVFKNLETFEDKTKKIGFQLFQEFDTVIKKATFYLYLYEGIIQSQTYQYLNEKHPIIFKGKDLIIFLPKENNQSDPSIRLSNIENKFKPISAFYIDDFIREKCTPSLEFDKSKFLSISNFVIPLGNGLNKKDLQTFVKLWFEENSKPILAINGTGGIGKTTFAQFIADLWIQKSPNTHVIFIDSAQIKDLLMRDYKFLKGLSLYSFYEAFLEKSGSLSERLTEDLFRMNVDAGNMLIIIDGLDEVISKVPNFKIDLFLQSIKEASKELANGKVVITCRTHFWDTTAIGEIDVSVVELEPFNFDQAKQFFEKSLDSNTKIKKALKLTEQFKYKESESGNLFHPYVLDVVRSIVGSNGEVIDVDLSEFGSKILKKGVMNDYIIYRICDRERKRVGQISVDEQIKFFIYLAAERRGTTKVDNLRQFIEEALGRKIDNTHSNAFKSHPFLTVRENTLTFKYDFLADLFKSIYITTFFDFDSEKSISENFISLVEENCWYGSGMNSDIASRIQHWTEYDMLFISELLRQVIQRDLSSNRKHQVIANILAITLLINSRFKGDDIEANTNLIKLLFQINNSIQNLSLINIGVEHNIRFDFSNLTFSKCYFRDYDSFWDCKFANTKFVNSHLLNLKTRTVRQGSPDAIFLDCVFDKETEEVLRKFETNDSNKIEQSKDFLNDFLHLFFSNGKLGRQWEHKIIEPRFSGIAQNRFSYNHTIKVLKSHGILEVTQEKGNTKMAIFDDHREEVVRFIKDGTMSIFIANIIKDLAN